MSKSKFNPLITVSVMSVVGLAGLSSSHQLHAMDQTSDAFYQESLITENSQVSMPPANAAGQRRYIILLDEPSLVAFSRQTSSVPTESRGRLDAQSAEAQAYVAELIAQQNEFIANLSGTFNRNVSSVFEYQYALNGVVLELTQSEAQAVKAMSNVKSVEMDMEYALDTDAGPMLIGADNIWAGIDPASGAAFGEGVVVGILDTGANFDHPSLADIGDDAYDHNNPLGAGNYLGVCDPTNTDQYDASYTCNDKLIGGYDFINDITPPGSVDFPGPEDDQGHGTHTATTAAGNYVTTAESNGVTGIEISGVARHANVVVFDVCFDTGCFGSAAAESIDQIISDGVVDVVNYSISGGQSPWGEAASLAFLSAVDAGVFVAASSGNFNPQNPPSQFVGHLEPWTASTANSTHNRRFNNPLTVTGPGTPPMTLEDVLAVQGTGPAMAVDMVGEINYAEIVDPGNVTGCNAFPALAFDGVIALISRGACSFADKVNNAEAAGAIGVVVHNNVGGDPIVMGGLDTTNLPSVMISLDAGTELATYITNNPGTTVSVASSTSISLEGQADSMSSGSSIGPSTFEYNKPDLTGPGTSILAGWADGDTATGTAAEYAVISGTSMSSPHTAGSAALLMELHPTWSVTEIKSALMMTAVTAGVTKSDQVTPADPFDRGAGRVQVDVASSTGLVMHETSLNFFQADPANGGDPKTLNMPSYKNDNCVGTCSFTRSFRSVANTSVEYNVTLVDMVGTVTPSNFTVFPGQTVNVTVEIDATALVAGAVSFGELQLTEADPAPDSFTINPSVAITDAGYSSPTAGTTGMVCEDIVVSGLANAPYLASLDVSMSHNDWLADLTLKLANPNGDLLTILNQSSAGTGVTLDAGIPISFFDGAGASADTLGSDGGAFGGDPACTLDPCEFFPFPNAEATPPGSFADLSVGDPNGTWQICVGDSAVGDTGVLESATLNITGEPPRPDLHLPLVVTGFPEQPDIEVSPTALSATLDPDMTTDLTLTVINTDLAGAELNWSIAPDGTSAEVLEQAVNGTSGIISDFYTPDDTGVYSADDFVLTGETTISTMFFGGFVNNQDLPDIATAIEVQIFTDNGGVPNGHPEDGLGSAVASLNIPIADASLDLTDDGIGIDVVAANGSPISLPAGTYWVTVYPVNAAAAFATDRWNWFAGTPANGSLAHLIDPSNFFGGGTDWTDLISLGVDASLAALNYRMDTMSTCGAPWLSVTPTSGTIAIDASEDLTVTIDSTGMTPGIYTAAVCIDSDDTSSPRVGVPVTLTVDGPSDLIFADGFEGP